MNDGTAIQVEELLKTCRTGGKEVEAIRGASLEAKRGEMVCLLGPNCASV